MLSQMAGFPLYGWIIFLCVCVCVCVCVFIYLSLNGHIGCFHVLAIVKNTPVNMGVQISLQHSDFFSLDIHPEVGLLDHKVVLFLIFWETSMLFSTVAAPICIPPKVHKGSFFSISSPYLLSFYNSHSNRCDTSL